MLKKVFKWLKRAFLREKPFKYIFIQDVPDKVKQKVVYIVGDDEFYWQLIMLCPCGCAAVLHMNLMNEEFPCWSFSFNKKNQISVYPSINRFVGCKSHFFVRGSKIVWA